MKNYRLLFTMSVALLALTVLMSTKADTPPKPDLQISNVIEAGETARILVRNGGNAVSGPCVLRAYRSTPNGWVVICQITVPAIPPCQTRWLSMTASDIKSKPTLYFVDATNVVAETFENNNQFMVPN